MPLSCYSQWRFASRCPLMLLLLAPNRGGNHGDSNRIADKFHRSLSTGAAGSVAGSGWRTQDICLGFDGGGSSMEAEHGITRCGAPKNQNIQKNTEASRRIQTAPFHSFPV